MSAIDINPPYALLAELTHRCPLRCIYCSNPLELLAQTSELSTSLWFEVLTQARALGVVQVHLSGGEPLTRPDLDRIVERAAQLGIYSNLITSGLGLTDARAQKLSAAGLSHVQLSIQAADLQTADGIAGIAAFEKKKSAAEFICKAGLPFSMNAVLHRSNLAQVGDIIDLCRAWGAERLELANTQYYGWAMLNREALLPTAAELAQAESVYLQRKSQLQGEMELLWILSDYYEQFPKACMGGWGQLQLTVTPDGTVLPCQAAKAISSLPFENVRQRELSWIWNHSESFNKFRGFEWMKEPCHSCERKEIDFGGCRCQAFLLTGDAANTDPVCCWSPDRPAVDRVLAKVNTPPEKAKFELKFRGDSN
jgi:pyrroloquinoline quinone biosynthesis protein E